jgi:hypothetical protein
LGDDIFDGAGSVIDRIGIFESRYDESVRHFLLEIKVVAAASTWLAAFARCLMNGLSVRVLEGRHRLEGTLGRPGQDELSITLLLDLAHGYRDIMPAHAQESTGADDRV